MKKIIASFFISLLFSCATSKVDPNEKLTETAYRNVKIATSSKIIEKDTITYNELRFYNVNSASDSMKSMFLDFGPCTMEDKGLHQNNINRKIWNKVALFNTKEVFSIVADGTETRNDYYACFIIVDTNNKDCLDENYPLKNKIVDFFYERMKTNKNKKE